MVKLSIGHIFKSALVASVALFCIGTVEYYDIEADEFVIMNAEVARSPNSEVFQYRVAAKRVKDGRQMVFRNEDAWMPWLKFSSANIQAVATESQKHDTKVRISYYGWRSTLTTRFWNILSIEKVKDK